MINLTFLYRTPLAVSCPISGVDTEMAAGPAVLTRATTALPTRNAFEVRLFSPESQYESAYQKPGTPAE